ncbi:PrsW family intramembrane metalloprotease [Patescibacteria group bacterium]|nr:PrsW family intramembrane metalloprotease [Patescibacteria group bacterium]
MTPTTLGYAFLGGLLPSFIWLYFLLKEDAAHPEPKKIILFAFVAGMAAVPLALPAEQWSCTHLPLETLLKCPSRPGFHIILSWALIEEVLKYVMAAAFILWRGAVDEAPDYVVYMLTVALGFAAAENMLFLGSPLFSGQFIDGIFTDNVRFLGSTLLHAVASASIGFALAFSSRSGPLVRSGAAALGLILAVALHTAFNELIINQGASTTLTAFFLVWTVTVIFFAAFEVLKYFQYRRLPNSSR